MQAGFGPERGLGGGAGGLADPGRVEDRGRGGLAFDFLLGLEVPAQRRRIFGLPNRAQPGAEFAQVVAPGEGGATLQVEIWFLEVQFLLL